MKRYWLSIVWVPFIVVCLGTFYIQAAAQVPPNFVLTKVEGDEKEAAGISMYGSYESNGKFGSQLRIDTEGSEYRPQRDFLPTDPFGNEILSQLMKEHRSFMRGKRSSNSFYEDEKRLVYVYTEWNYGGIGGQKFEVSVLNKENQETSSYEVEIPKSDQYDYIYVEKVQVIGDKIKAVTHNQRNSRPEVHLYTMELTSSSGLVEQVLYQESNVAKDINTNVYMINSESIATNPYVAYQIAQSKIMNESDGTRESRIIGGEVKVYDLASGKEMKVNSAKMTDAVKSTMGSNPELIQMDKDQLYMLDKGAGSVQVVQYGITTGTEAIKEYKIAAVDEFAIKNNRLYTLSNGKSAPGKPPVVTVMELQTGKVLYQGQVATEGFEALDLYNLNVQ